MVYLVSCILPKDKNLWVFGAWFGRRYADNSRYVFEYAQRDKDIKAVWISKARAVVAKIRKDGGTAFLSYSPKGICHMLKAGIAIVSNGQLDINAALVGGAVKVQLWHGAPMKKLMYEDNKFRADSFAKKWCSYFPIRLSMRRFLYSYIRHPRPPRNPCHSAVFHDFKCFAKCSFFRWHRFHFRFKFPAI